MKSWSTLRVTVLSPFVELLQSPFPLHSQNITAEEVQIGLSLFKRLQGQVPWDLSASSVNIKEVLSTLSAVKTISLW